MSTALQQIQSVTTGLVPVEALTKLAELFPGEVIFSTSFGWEDQVISHMIFANNLPIKVFTLETGRLFRETYSVWAATMNRYQKPIHAYYPNNELLEEMVSKKGPNSFYESVENRKECCGIRKIEPLKRALKGNKIWITGIRAEQSINRHDMHDMEWDEQNQLVKFHPIFSWTLDEVKAYIKQYNIPYNSLHDKGFPSIGCMPCTRAVAEGEDFRAGRWWWEDQSKKECGLHETAKP
ncbi:phosphoadenylyl-sulfate reductase [Mucilaginibacter rubeus]|uniref:Adenosine 5'-phosphosulfate reductase n=1 Tax=Mucilaginibacter rubeus TaxID=2027860 RepID=A0AAE6JG27_9SPHI|nr:MULTISPECIES: phosphoadenylyl-sulfate reductase [Mucilaginibacter]QEM04112.1 phosphoadenylyl-sulfate reductase [Mucilaginibacter rubeus]QEM16715.1 phosphoadenylyl-sulfate reductase [Mucilaginibacter gossypii]QTE46810.1 phosphoadenylyl-sulfate reductase [Mucilaginibacter rubeus]QTE53407.1 phosphoadenylyl-sulfate reductase [Mucilaginibacter rubeus]QTE58493.1 phosphoadenylyl-sulfate reductase [Mucilaginibacter rubeus]